MVTKTPSRSPRRWHNLGEAARQSNHVVAAAVFAFVSSILLQYLLSSPLVSMADWIHGRLGTAGAAILGPFLVDGPTALVLLVIAFPFGRVTAARPWVAGTALVLLVQGFWFSFHFVIGEHLLLWGEVLPVVGRGVFTILTLFGVVWLMRWGRRVALEADRGAIPASDQEEGPKEMREPETVGETVDKPETVPLRSPGKEPSPEREPEDDPRVKQQSGCKDPGPPDVLGGER